jgi:hypothetical protein
MEFSHPSNHRSRFIPCFVALIAAALFGVCVEMRAQLSGLHITEVMARNGAALFDESGETPDWVEITNFTESPMDLRDYGLSNDPDQAFLYRFPPFTLEAGQRVIVFCSGQQLRHLPELRNLNLKKPVVEGELFHLDAANPDSFIFHDNGQIQTWLDQSNSANHASQLDPQKAPVFHPIAPGKYQLCFLTETMISFKCKRYVMLEPFYG